MSNPRANGWVVAAVLPIVEKGRSFRKGKTGGISTRTIRGTLRRLTRGSGLLSSALGMILILSLPQAGIAGEGQPTVPNVEDQFRSLQRHGDGLAFMLGEGANFNNWPDWAVRYGPCKHYQGIARMDVDGTPYFFLTRSGNHTAACPGASDNPGELLVVRMGSKNALGERLRSNRLLPGASMDATLPPAADIGLKSIIFGQVDEHGEEWPAAMHAGGIQLIDGVLVIPLDIFCPAGFKPNDQFPQYSPASDDCRGDNDAVTGSLLLVDVADPEHPRLLHEFATGISSAVAVTRNPRTGRYLFATIEDFLGNGNKSLAFRSSNTDDLRSESLSLELVGWDPSPPEAAGWYGFGMINFVTQDDGALYLVGSDNTNQNEPIIVGTDFLRLFKVHQSVFDLDGRAFHDYIGIEQKSMLTEHPDMGNCKAACGVYVSPSGELIVYTAHHDPFQPMWPSPPDEWFVAMGEFRHVDVTHDRALERVDVDGDGRLEDSCSGWVELYENERGWEESAKQETNHSLMFDFRDRHLDNWEHLEEYNSWVVDGIRYGFNDETSAYRWNLPPSQKAWLYEHADFKGERIELTGRGSVGSIHSAHPGWNDRISSLLIGPVADPGRPYVGAKQTPIPLDAANPCYGPESSVRFEWNVESASCSISDSAARRPSIECEEEGIYPVSLTVTDTTEVAGNSVEASASATVDVSVAVFAAGKKLLVKQGKSGSQRLVLLARDADIRASSPCEVDGELVVEAGGAGTAVRLPLDAGHWKPLNPRKPEKGCEYRNGSSVARVRIHAGRRLRVVGKGFDLLPLDDDPRPVRIEVRHGEIRHCFEVGGASGAYRAGRKLITRNVAPGAQCPEGSGVD